MKRGVALLGPSDDSSDGRGRRRDATDSLAGRPTDGRVYVIEAKTNPRLDPAAEYAMAAKESGRAYTAMIGEIIEQALARS